MPEKPPPTFTSNKIEQLKQIKELKCYKEMISKIEINQDYISKKLIPDNEKQIQEIQAKKKPIKKKKENRILNFFIKIINFRSYYINKKLEKEINKHEEKINTYKNDLKESEEEIEFYKKRVKKIEKTLTNLITMFDNFKKTLNEEDFKQINNLEIFIEFEENRFIPDNKVELYKNKRLRTCLKSPQ